MNDPQLTELIANYRQVARDAPSAASDARIRQALDAFARRRQVRSRRRLAFALAASLLLLAGVQWQHRYAATDRVVRDDVPAGYLDGRAQTFLLEADATPIASSPTAQYLLAHAQPAD